ncbi:MAG: hypothetical protein ACNA8W_22155, partial [Bradymonadaceae bacterium]
MLTELLVNAALLPTVAAIIFLGLAALTGRGWLSALAVAGAVIAASVGLRGLPVFPPRAIIGWLPILALGAAGVAVATHFIERARWRWVLRWGFSALGVGVLIWPML